MCPIRRLCVAFAATPGELTVSGWTKKALSLFLAQLMALLEFGICAAALMSRSKVRSYQINCFWYQSLVLAEPTDTITSVQISKTEIAVGCADGFVYRYDIVAGKLRRDYVASQVCSFMLADGCLLVQSQDGNLRLLDANGGKYIF
jgi:hypothetical protein